MKTIECKECGSVFTIDSTQESETEQHVISKPHDYNEDILCPACAQNYIMEVLHADIHV